LSFGVLLCLYYTGFIAACLALTAGRYDCFYTPASLRLPHIDGWPLWLFLHAGLMAACRVLTAGHYLCLHCAGFTAAWLSF
jgi:hypothetical protein